MSDSSGVGTFFAGLVVGGVLASVGTYYALAMPASGGQAAPKKSRWERGGAGLYAIGYKDDPKTRGRDARIGLVDGPFDTQAEAKRHAERMDQEGFYGRTKRLSAAAAARLYRE